MNMEPSKNIFRAYDVRGVFNKDLNSEIACKIGFAFGKFLKENKKNLALVARDVRTSSRIIELAVLSSLASSGIDCISYGLLPICVANFKIFHERKIEAGAYITASHNPPEYNGIRLRKEDGTGYAEENQIVWKYTVNENFEPAPWDKLGKIEEVEEKETVNEYIDFLLNRIKIKGKKIKAVLDIGNGAAFNTAPQLLAEAGVDVKAINSEPNGLFPARGSEPNKRTLRQLMEIVKKEKADFGAGYDGDADRVIFVDDKGRVVKTEKIGIILAREFFRKSKNKVVIANISCSSIVEEEVEKLGGRVVRTRVGDVFVAEAIKKHNAVLGIETSAHLFMPEFYPFDDPILATLLIAKILSEENKKLSELESEIPDYYYEELNIACDDEIKFKVVERIAEKYEKAGYDVTRIDGLRVSFSDGWFLIRPSNTNPLIRIAAEAKEKEKLNELLKIAENEVATEERKLKSYS